MISRGGMRDMLTLPTRMSTNRETTSRIDRFADAIVQVVPDALTSSILFLMVLAGAAWAMGARPIVIVDSYYRGFWSLLPFTAQMTLIILLGSALSTTPFFQRLITTLAAKPRTQFEAVAGAVLLSATCSYCFWGLRYAVNPLIAVNFAYQATRRGIRIHFPFFMATVYAAGAVWQYGLSASAPLLIATPGHFLEKTIGVIPLSRTIWSPAAILDVVIYLVVIVLFGWRFMPRAERPITEYADAVALAEAAPAPHVAPRTYAERLEHHSFFTLVLCGAMAMWLWYHFFEKGAGLNINSLNMILFLLTFLLHGNARNVSKALARAATGAWPVIVLYHLYAGLTGLIEHTPVGDRMASLVAAGSSAGTFPFLSAAIGTVFAFFIPSSGGQWAIQGLVTVKAAMALNVSVERAMLSMSVGDHMGNLTSPFWYVVVAGVARLDFRSFFGYGLIYAVIWFVIGVFVFTFAPC